jgi:hypothetical protein
MQIQETTMDVSIIPEMREITTRRPQYEGLYRCYRLKGLAFIAFVILIFILAVLAAINTFTEGFNKPPALSLYKNSTSRGDK